MNLPKERLQNGDSLICYSNGWLGRQIQRFTKSGANHAAKVIKVSGVLMVIDSQRNGTNVKTFENWLAEYGYNYRVYRYRYANPNWGKAIRERALSKAGVTGYDFMSLFVWQPWYLLTGKWAGRKREQAENRMYCSEYVGWVDELPDWWTLSPADLERFYQNSKFWVHVTQ
jgi:hypothetical protein